MLETRQDASPLGWRRYSLQWIEGPALRNHFFGIVWRANKVIDNVKVNI